MQLATFARHGQTGARIAEQLREVVTEHDQRAPRSQQTALGPSEIGEPCPAALARKLMGEQRVNARSDPWPAIVGTATHAWLAEAFHAANQRLGRIRYLVETRVQIRAELAGSCDCYDADHGGVAIDHKVVGETAMRSYKRDGPSAQYRAQIHLYGMGLANLGLPVSTVAIAFYPRGGMLSGLHVWTEPYDPAVAQAALDRHDQILEAACALGLDHTPGNYAHLPIVTGHRCTFCPYFSPGVEIGRACPGHMPQ